MKKRIALWFLAGFSVACAWVLVMTAVGPATGLRLETQRFFLTIAEITAPAALLHSFPLKYYWFILLNGLIYCLVGLVAELFSRTSPRHLFKFTD